MRCLRRDLALALILIMCCGAAYAENKVVLQRGEGGFPGYGAIAGVAAAGDAVYICEFYEQKMYAYRTGDEAAAVYAFEDGLYPLALCAGEDGALYRIAAAYSEDGGEIEEVGLYRVNLGEDMVARTELIVSLAWDNLIYYASGAAQSREVASCLVQGNDLYAVCETEDGRRLLRFNLETGAAEDMGIESVREVKAYRDGALLLLRGDADADTAFIEAFDPATGGTLEMASMGRDGEGNRPVGLCYDAAEDRVLYTYDGAVRARGLSDGGEETRVTGMPLVYGMLDAVCLPGHYLPFNSEAVVTLDVTSPSDGVRTLRVYTELMHPSRNSVTRFLTENPNVELIYETGFETTNDLISALITQNQEIDVFSLDTGNSDLLTRLIDKGFAARIDSETCAAFADGLYPVLRDEVTREGNLYALPTSIIMAECLGINRQAFFDAGFAEEEIPRTWPELIDFVAAWPGRGIGESDLLLFDSGSLSGMGLRTMLVARLLDDYEAYMTADGSVGYDTDLLRGLLNKAAEIDFDAFSPIYSGDAGYEPDGNVPALFTANDYPSVVEDDSPFTYLPVALADGMDASVTVACTAFAVNVYSPDQDIAAAFLECLMGDIAETEQADMSPEYPDVLIRPDDYESMVLGVEQYLKEAETLYENAESEEQKELYAQAVQGAKDGLVELEDYYLTSEESVAEYRAAMGTAVFYVNRNPESVTEEVIDRFATYRDRMLSGQISVDAFISFLTETREMQLLEDQ